MTQVILPRMNFREVRDFIKLYLTFHHNKYNEEFLGMLYDRYCCSVPKLELYRAMGGTLASTGAKRENRRRKERYCKNIEEFNNFKSLLENEFENIKLRKMFNDSFVKIINENKDKIEKINLYI